MHILSIRNKNFLTEEYYMVAASDQPIIPYTWTFKLKKFFPLNTEYKIEQVDKSIDDFLLENSIRFPHLALPLVLSLRCRVHRRPVTDKEMYYLYSIMLNMIDANVACANYMEAHNYGVEIGAANYVIPNLVYKFNVWEEHVIKLMAMGAEDQLRTLWYSFHDESNKWRQQLRDLGPRGKLYFTPQMSKSALLTELRQRTEQLVKEKGVNRDILNSDSVMALHTDLRKPHNVLGEMLAAMSRQMSSQPQAPQAPTGIQLKLDSKHVCLEEVPETIEDAVG